MSITNKDSLCTLSLLSLFALGCAHTSATTTSEPTIIDNHNGKMLHVPRSDLRLQGDAYSLSHLRAHPRSTGPADGTHGHGGKIQGEVCGLNVSFTVAHRGDHLTLQGEVSSTPASFFVGEMGGLREIHGVLGQRSVEIRYSDRHLYGRIGAMSMDFSVPSSLDDRLVFLSQDGQGDPLSYSLVGRAALWKTPAADQAVLLPLLLSCLAQQTEGGERRGEVTFSAPAPLTNELALQEEDPALFHPMR